MMSPVTVRFPRVLMDEIETIMHERPLLPSDKGHVIRELVAEAVEARWELPATKWLRLVKPLPSAPPVDPAATDGTENAVGVLAADVDATLIDAGVDTVTLTINSSTGAITAPTPVAPAAPFPGMFSDPRAEKPDPSVAPTASPPLPLIVPLFVSVPLTWMMKRPGFTPGPFSWPQSPAGSRPRPAGWSRIPAAVPG